ncbi:MAG: PhnD/SsuA/transferrin family substrate-binding protein [Chromatiales bacterium]|nr:PhnD/SsuA/transferrin family substrate-binding protein [Chromatiales bacterium]
MILRASLPMYDLPEVRKWTDRLWAAIAEELREGGVAGVPDALERPSDCHDAWRGDGLLFSQTCGYPAATALRDVLRVVATPHYAAPGCEGPRYSSVVVVRRASRVADLEELRGAVCAFNSRDSQSGYNALRAAIAPIARGGWFFARTVETGAHAASMEAVRCGRADVCAVDCVTWALHARHRPSALVGLEVIRYTEPAPGLPFVTAGDVSDATFASIREALGRAFVRPDLAETRDALLISGLSILPADAYEPLLAMERAAAASGYPDLE